MLLHVCAALCCNAEALLSMHRIDSNRIESNRSGSAQIGAARAVSSEN